MQITAAQLNDHLASDPNAVVQITTCTRSTLYDAKHAGWFEQRGGEVYVRRGRGRECLTNRKGEPLVAIRTGRWVPKAAS